MARPCTVCSDSRRERIDGKLLSGQSVSQVWTEYVEKLGVCSLSALYRHARSHVGGLGPLTAITGEAAADHVGRLVALANMQREIGEHAAARGAEAVALRASAEERQTRALLLDRLGADADAIASELADLRELYDLISHSIRTAPEQSRAWADAFDGPGLEQFAADIRRAASAILADRAEH